MTVYCVSDAVCVVGAADVRACAVFRSVRAQHVHAELLLLSNVIHLRPASSICLTWETTNKPALTPSSLPKERRLRSKNSSAKL